MLPIGIVSAKGIWKKFPILQVGGPSPAPPTPPVIGIVLLHTEAADKDLCPDTVLLGHDERDAQYGTPNLYVKCSCSGQTFFQGSVFGIFALFQQAFATQGEPPSIIGL